jgi:hypothetical protein
MARHASTYRQYRRMRWAEYRMSGSPLSWADYNKQFAGAYDIKAIREQSPQPWWHQASSRPAPSKYVPHIGAKQRAKTAGRPDGAMHYPSKER